MAVSSIEGVFNDELKYHYDVAGDVLYARLLSAVDEEVYGDEEDHDGVIALRPVVTDRIVGFTIWSYWQRFGRTGQAPGSILTAGNAEEILERALGRFGRVRQAV